MKKVLCYGDSNTYGFIPEKFTRYSDTERWTKLLSVNLGNDFEVIEQGLNNRNGFIKNPQGKEFCGVEYLPEVLKKYQDTDIFIIALGTNDSQFEYNLDRKIVQNGLQAMIDLIKKSNQKIKIIIVPPVKIDKNIKNGFFSRLFDKKSIKITHETFETYKEISTKNNCLYIDFNEFVKPSDVDGLHYTPQGHKTIAKHLSEFILKYYLGD